MIEISFGVQVNVSVEEFFSPGFDLPGLGEAGDIISLTETELVATTTAGGSVVIFG